MTAFLDSLDYRDLVGAYPAGVRPVALFLGRGDGALEVAQFVAKLAPTRPQLRELHEIRRGKRATPVLVVVLHGSERASLAARFGDDWSLRGDLDAAQVERLAAAALAASDRHAADDFLRQRLAQLAEQPIPGVRNAGLFALHNLEHGVPRRPDWAAACTSGRPLLPLRGRALVERLGFTVDALPGPASVLRASGTRVALAVFLERADEIERASERYDDLSPVSYALAKADTERLDFVVVSAGTVLRIYPARPGVGTARRGRTETFVELDVALLDQAAAGYLSLIASADALSSGGTFAQLLEESRRFASDLGARLRDRVYTDVMPALCESFVKARRLRNPSRETLAETFEMALLTLFRLLFVAYAEDKELLPYHTNATYHDKALKTLAQRLQREQEENAAYGATTAYWDDVRQLWQAVDKGNRAWGVPAYNGGLFASGDVSSKSARLLGEMVLPDIAFAPALRSLLLDVSGEDTLGPVDFRALGVREFGTIYEGLLEQELSVADQDLGVNAQGAYVPTAAPRSRGRTRPTASEVLVRAGQVYLHDKSGARKASGAYYTKDFAVEHLLERALGPALAEHCARLDATYDEREAADCFFDFHVADIAMGSGHFLVAAVDHIERGLAGYLAKRPLGGVRDELARLRTGALAALGDGWRGEPIEDTQLLRRQIARRCIHGVDLNPLAVELARLSLWIHTFVPGLPLSFLDATLVCGNALVGIATFDEARELIGAEEEQNLFAFTAEDLIAKAREPLSRLAKLSEATAAEVKDARKYYGQAKAAIGPTDDLFTVLAASRVDTDVREAVDGRQVSTGLKRGDLFADRLIRKSEKALAGLRPLHFPTTFPQVFDRPRAGFDVILGNPPWQETTIEELAFWARHEPGLRGLNRQEQGQRVTALKRERADLAPLLAEEVAEAERMRAVLTTGPFPGMGTGDPDLYKAFCWRFWALVAADGGRIGVVLPRSAFAAKGSTEFRLALFEKAQLLDLTMLLNTGGWVFDEAEPRYTIALACIARGVTSPDSGAVLLLDGPYADRARYEAGLKRVAERPAISTTQVRAWNDSASLPLLPYPRDAEVFLKLRRAPRLDLDAAGQWRARPYAELHATNDAPLMDLKSTTRPRGFWPVFKGESFDLWTSDRGTEHYYGWADPRVVVPELQRRRESAVAREGSPFSEFSAAWARAKPTLPCQHARIAFRDVTRSTDSRTVRAALVPPRVVLTNKAPYLLWPRGDGHDQAFVLGALSSLPLDWYARRFVEVSLNYFVFNPFPIPRPAADHPLRGRVIALSGRLAVQADDRFEEWGAAIGVVPSPITGEEKDEHIAELDAAVFHLYGLEERDLVHVFESFHEGWDFTARLKATLRHFHRLAPQA